MALAAEEVAVAALAAEALVAVTTADSVARLIITIIGVGALAPDATTATAEARDAWGL